MKPGYRLSQNWRGQLILQRLVTVTSHCPHTCDSWDYQKWRDATVEDLADFYRPEKTA